MKGFIKKFFTNIIILNFFLHFTVASAFSLEKIDEINAAVKQDSAQHHIMGLAISIIDHDPIHYLHYGRINVFSQQMPDNNSIFEIASLTKIFTGLLLIDSIENNTVHLNDKIAKYIPELSQYAAGDITLRQLVTHTSGLARMPTHKFFKESNPLDPYADFSEEALISYLQTIPSAELIPAQTYSYEQYSNTGFLLLGVVLERANYTSYQTLLTERILKPLELNDTSIALTNEQQQRLVTGYDIKLEQTPYWHFLLPGCGALHSTLNDLTKFTKLNLQNNNDYLSKLLEISHHQLVSGIRRSIAYAWQISGKGNNQIIWHSGLTGGFSSYIAFNMHKQLGLVILSNTPFLPKLDSIVFN